MATRREFVEARAQGRCEYCLAPQAATAYAFHLEHILPRSKGGLDQLSNYALACVNCNLLKSQHIEHKDPETDVKTRLFNPRTDEWKQHFRFSRGTLKIIGKTPIGRATERLLQLNSAKQLQARRFWVELGIYP